MNYLQIYNQIIFDPRNHLLKKGEYEIHHIIPRSLGGSNEQFNLVKLRPRFHYVCHWLLTKIYSGENRNKMISALHFMIHGRQGNFIRISSHIYEKLKFEFCSVQSERMKGFQHTEETKQNMRKPKSESHKNSLRKIIKTQQHRKNLSVSCKGRIVKQATKQLISNAGMNNKNCVGRIVTEDMKVKIRNKRKLQIMNPVTDLTRFRFRVARMTVAACKRISNGTLKIDDWKFL